MKPRLWIAWALALALVLPTAAFPDADPKPMAPIGSPYDRGRQAVSEGQWETAVGLFQEAVQENPRDHAAYNMLGYALRKTEKPQEALEAYNRALALKPDYAPALEYRAEAYLMLKNRQAAMTDYQALVKLNSPLAQDLKQKIDSAPAN
ncbi:MAG: tetratricopeptide repeat protein [Candidatus Tectomicrobia bacterium]|uniref:Tetratricopeptide repeat protein n=1 Tax=Tectimicrobiota bacterium TaxID=2528274 RepID=A0A932MND5_UNCTE|nr:tetratricopeptide repeat protein [Candidatus Tectomicrobia bacterium]